MLNDLNEWLDAHVHSLTLEAETELTNLIHKHSPNITIHDGATSETATQNKLRLAAPLRGGFLWRNNNGVAVDKTGRHIRYGLGNDSKRLNEVFKSSDLIGVIPVVIQPKHVGKTFGLFVAVEVKKPDWHLIPSDKRGHAQLNFITTINSCGGLGCFATHENHLNEGLKQWFD